MSIVWRIHPCFERLQSACFTRSPKLNYSEKNGFTRNITRSPGGLQPSALICCRVVIAMLCMPYIPPATNLWVRSKVRPRRIRSATFLLRWTVLRQLLRPLEGLCSFGHSANDIYISRVVIMSLSSNHQENAEHLNLSLFLSDLLFYLFGTCYRGLHM